MGNKSLKTAAFGLILSMCSISSHATVVYDNFGPGDTFNTNIGYEIDSYYDQGSQFTPSNSGLFTSLDVGMGTSNPYPLDVTFTLYADANGFLGNALESVTITVNTYGGTLGTSTGVASGTTSLVAGQNYWLIAHSVSGGGATWNLNSTNDIGSLWTNGSINRDYPLKGTFRINASVVPVPAAVWLFSSGLIGLIGVAMRKKV